MVVGAAVNTDCSQGSTGKDELFARDENGDSVVCAREETSAFVFLVQAFRVSKAPIDVFLRSASPAVNHDVVQSGRDPTSLDGTL